MNSSLQRVWLILTKVDVVGENPAGLQVGSDALVQCFLPVTEIESALSAVDDLLHAEGMRRSDVLSCTSFSDMDDESESPEFIKKDIAEARRSRRSLTGTFFTNEETA
jgi:enamine deaminase RidA (YjgF/YER057c/UK114 family)